MNIKDKIKKLLSLAESPNENEARDAMLKAKELMAKHKLSDSDFKKEAKLIEQDCDVKWTTDSGDAWMTSLCKLIADNYCCSASWRTPKATRTHTLIIAGFEEDVTICKEVVTYAVGFINGKTKILAKKNPRASEKTVKQSYAEGFILGLELAYEMQKEEHPEWGLVVVKPQEVKDYEDKLGNKNVRYKKAEFDPLAYMQGQIDGKEFNASKVIGVAQ